MEEFVTAWMNGMQGFDLSATIDYYFNSTLGYVEIAATIALIICVYQAATQNIWTWFWGAIGVILFGYLVYEFQLYSDAALQIFFYLPVQAFGWYWWMKRGPNADNDLPVVSLNLAAFLSVLSGIFVMTMTTGFYFANYTDAAFPYIDALTTWMSIAAQVLMIKKVWESWHLWIAMDLIAINVYFAKGLIVTSGLYIIFTGLATFGLIAWYKAMKEQGNQSNVVAYAV